MDSVRKCLQYIISIPVALCLIAIGLFALITPFTPGSWLALIGLGMLCGKSFKEMSEIARNYYQRLKKKFK